MPTSARRSTRRSPRASRTCRPRPRPISPTPGRSWTRYHSEWATLPFESKQEFAYHVLAIAYGEQAAAQALGLNAGGGAAQPGAGGGAAPSVDDMIGNVPGTTDCWASAGCSGYDPGSGTYTYESYE